MDALTCEIREFGGDGVLAVRVAVDRRDGERFRYVYSLTYAGELIASGDDLRSGSGDDIDHPGMLATLLSFLESAGESYRDVRRTGNNGLDTYHGFNEYAARIFALMSDEIAMARLEIEEAATV